MASPFERAASRQLQYTEPGVEDPGHLLLQAGILYGVVSFLFGGSVWITWLLWRVVHLDAPLDLLHREEYSN